MTDIDATYCDFCRSNTDPRYENDGHEDWCPVLEIQQLREALRGILKEADEMLCPGPDGYNLERIEKIAREALGDE